MKNILRFMKGSRKIVIVILLLLVAQAWCDLSLPDLTSKILNIGLQQGGIEDAVPDTIRAESLEDLELFVPDEDIETIEKAYGEADENGVRHLLAEADREELNALLLQPESILYGISNAASFSMDGWASGADSEETAQGETETAAAAENAAGEGTDEAAGAADSCRRNSRPRCYAGGRPVRRRNRRGRRPGSSGGRDLAWTSVCDAVSGGRAASGRGICPGRAYQEQEPESVEKEDSFPAFSVGRISALAAVSGYSVDAHHSTRQLFCSLCSFAALMADGRSCGTIFASLEMKWCYRK